MIALVSELLDVLALVSGLLEVIALVSEPVEELLEEARLEMQ